MPTFDFAVREGTTRRIQLAGLDANGAPYDYTGTTVELIAKTASSTATAALTFSMVVDELGAGTSTPAGRIFLGRPDPDDLDGPLIDTEATSGYLTIRFAPEDTAPLVTNETKTFLYEARVVAGDDAYTLLDGSITVEDSLFPDEV